MPITIDHRDIQEALKKFDIDSSEYYLEFNNDNDVVFMHWVSDPEKITNYLRHSAGCLAIQLKGTWFYEEDLPDDYGTYPLINCRYILETI
jgi:hypothetical protein